MATVHIDDDTPTREVVRETQVSDNGGTALTILAILLIAIIAVGAYLYYNGSSSRAPSLDRAVTHVEKGVSDAGDTVTRSTTTTTQQ